MSAESKIAVALKFVAPLLVVCVAWAASQGSQQRSWQLTPDLTIGSLNERDHSLTRIDGLAVSSSQHIFVLQYQEAVVKEFDSRGKFIRQIGRRGSGPGEFTSAIQLWWRNGELLVLDDGTGRISRFDSSGTHVGSLQVSRMSPYPLQRVELLRDGSIVGVRRVSTQEIMARKARTPLVRAYEGQLDTLAWLDLDGSVASFSSTDGRRSVVTQNPFSEHDFFRANVQRNEVILIQRRAMQRAKSARLLWLNAGGDTLRRSDLTLPPLGRTSLRFQDSIFDSFSQVLAQARIASSPGEARAMVRRQLRVPGNWTLQSEAIAASDGSVWLRHGSEGNSARWIVVDSAGRPIAKVLVPGSAVLHVVEASMALAVAADSFGVPSVVRYRIRR